MKTVTEFPRAVVEHADMAIVMSDGCRLSARVWMPQDALERPVPAILEHLPYRKRDGTATRDALTHPYFAGHGYACLRVDMRGNGDSEGLMEDEYTEQELADACEVIAWAARQPWCNGRVGMMGISWGGFNALQVAAKEPPALKAIITLCSTDDRYADDIHYKGGLLLNENLGWGATMLAYSSRPPDPAIVGERWRAMWLKRLENEPFLPALWLAHQTRDAYWKRGSVCENFAAIKAATLAIGGWHDAYKNAVSRLVQGISAPVKGIVGPWVHKYPHFAVPRPTIGFLQEALRWWDRWLKDESTGVENDPAMRLYLMDSLPPREFYEERPGRWIAEPVWPSPRIQAQSFTFGREIGADITLPAAISSPQDCGLKGGEYCAIWLGPELPGDQCEDDARSLCFDMAINEPLDIVGGPLVRLRISADRPVAMVAVRLCDVHPDGASARITYGVLNLTHDQAHAVVRPLMPGSPVDVTLRLDDIAWCIPAGHRLRLAISSTYWPMVWPSPEPVTLTIHDGHLDLPVRPSSCNDEWHFAESEAASPCAVETRRPASNRRDVERDQSGMVHLVIEDDFGEIRDLEHGLMTGAIARERWSIRPDDPLSARGATHWTETLSRDEWSVRTETFTQMWSDRTSFFLEGRIEAFEGDRKVFSRHFLETIARNGI
jgi:predicted acyl esterase